MHSTKHALIIGGGIAGPAAALALAKAGIRASIYEAYECSSAGVGASLTLAPNGVNALKAIGLEQAVAAIGLPVPQMVIANGNMKALARFGTPADSQPSLVMTRSELSRVLNQAAMDAGIAIIRGKRLRALSESRDHVRAEFDDGSSARGDMLIGADGIHSSVRLCLDPSAPAPEYAGILGFGGVAPHAVLTTTPGTMTFVFGKHGFFGYWPEPRGICWFASLPHDVPLSNAQIRQVTNEDWLARLRAFYGDDAPAQQILAQASADGLMTAGASHMMPPLPRWHSERVVLVGDAAHAPSSSSGQGASLAIESAIELAQCLRDFDTTEQAFARYESLRRPRVEAIAANAAKSNSQKAQGPLARAIMHWLMPLALKTFFNPTKRLSAQQSYRIDWDTDMRQRLR